MPVTGQGHPSLSQKRQIISHTLIMRGTRRSEWRAADRDGMVGCRAWVQVSEVEISMDDSDRRFSGAEVKERVAEIWHAFRAIGHPLTDQSRDRVRRILSGELEYESAMDEISELYSRTVAELAGDLVTGVFTEANFVEAVVNIPGVRQLSSDSGVPVRGPIAELHDALISGLVNSDVHDRTLAAMIAAGHEA